MKRTRKRIRFDYSNVKSKSDFQYWGIHPKKGRLHIDTKRYKNICYKEGMIEHIPKGLFKNRATPYFIPMYKSRYDYKFNLFRDLITRLRDDWEYEYKPIFKNVMTPSQVYDNSRSHDMMYTSCSDDFDDIEFNAMMNSIRRERKYAEIMDSLYFQFIQKICVEVNRFILIVCKEVGYESKDFDVIGLYKFSDKLSKENSKLKIEKFKEYDSFNSLNKINNFLKHNSVAAYETLKKFYPKYVRQENASGEKIFYENGYYAGN
ncbi:MAG: hypothetical protein FWE36_00075 [Erysipelotrichales bacterium]|nr:hypothetical protein [Erysipelotrichales bacterium]